METPRKRLVPFMKRMIGRCPGVIWHDQDQGTFRIPWRHFNNKEWSEQDSKIFQEWAKITGKYKSGDECDWPAWKTQLRCALNKIPDIEPVPDQYQVDSANPYRVYKFVSTAERASVQSRKASRDSDGSPAASPNSVADETRGNSPPMEQIDRILEQNMNHLDFLQTPIEPIFLRTPPSPLVPTVVKEEAEKGNWIENPVYYELNDVPVMFSPQNSEQTVLHHIDTSGNTHQTGLQIDYLTEEPCNPTPVYIVEVPQVNSPQTFSNTHIMNVVSQPLAQFLPEDRHETTENDGPRFPSDLKSLDSANLCPMETSLPTENSSIPSSFGSNVRSEIEALSHPLQVSFKVFYGAKRQCEVLNGKLRQRGSRLFFSKLGANFWENTVLKDESVFGPAQVEQLELPSVAQYRHIIEEGQQNKLNQLLDNMERGLVLTIQGRDIYAQRLCKTRVFATDGVSYSKLLERPAEQSTKVFDFKEQEEKKMPKMILTFGQEIKRGHSDPMKRVLLSMELEYDLAGMLEDGSLSLSSMSSSVNLISHDDQNDGLITQFKRMSVQKLPTITGL